MIISNKTDDYTVHCFLIYGFVLMKCLLTLYA